jgi:hypothetical protein
MGCASICGVLQRLGRHSPADWLIGGLAIPVVAVARTTVLCLPYRWWRSVLSAEARGRTRSWRILAPARVGWAVAHAAQFVPGATCLVQAMAARWLLHLGGHPSTLSLGVRRSDGEGIEAHAWLISAGQPVVGVRTDSTFRIMSNGEITAGEAI